MQPHASEAPIAAASALRPATSVELVLEEVPNHFESPPGSPQTWSPPQTAQTQSSNSERGSTFDDLLGQLAKLHRQEVQAMQIQLQESAARIQQLRPLGGEEGSTPLPSCVSSETGPVAGPHGGRLFEAGPPPSHPEDTSCPPLLYREFAPNPLKVPDADRLQDAGRRASSASEQSMQLSEAPSVRTPSGKWKFAMSDAWKGLGDEEEEVLASRTSGRAGNMDLASRLRMFRSLTNSGTEVGSFWETEPRIERSRCTGCAWESVIPASPGSPARLLWDFFGAALIFYDLFKLPMETFSPPETAFSKGMDWFILCFWTLNVFASLSVGYVEHGMVVLSMRKILLRYMRTWFAVDLLVLVPDWTFTIVMWRPLTVVPVTMVKSSGC